MSSLPAYQATLRLRQRFTCKLFRERQNRGTRKDRKRFCAFCDSRGHGAQDCTKITEIADRIERLKRANLCFLCLNWVHKALNCGKRGKAKCAKCRKSHHITICDEGNKTKVPATETNFTSIGGIEVTLPALNYLHNAQVCITGPTGLSKLPRCLMVGGSQSSINSASLIDDLKLEAISERELTACPFESQSAQLSKRRLVRFDMKGVWTHSAVTITAYESTHAFQLSQVFHKTLRL